MNNQTKKQVKFDDIIIIHYIKSYNNVEEKSSWEMDLINRQHFKSRNIHVENILDPILKQKIIQINEEKNK